MNHSVNILYIRIFACAAVMGLVFAFVYRVDAAFNEQINYQGKLLNATSVTVADGSYNIRFRLYTQASGGSPIWTEEWCKGATCNGSGADNRIAVTSGLFSVMLGSTTALTGVDFNQTLYLGVEIGGSAASTTWDGEMTPRKRIGAVPAAFEAKNAATLGGVASTSFLRNDQAGTSSITSSLAALTINQVGTGNIFDLKDNGTTVFTVLDGGNIGIGTTTPTSGLVIAVGTTKPALTLSRTDLTTVWNFQQGANIAGLGSSNALNLFTNTTAADFGIRTSVSGNANFVITAAGNVGIGTTSPYSRLSVWSGTSGDGARTFDVVNSASSSVFSITNTGSTTLSGTLTVNGAGATSTFQSGINLSTGCFAVGGTCVGSGSGGTTLIAIKKFISSGTYVPTAGAVAAEVIVTGPGGGGGSGSSGTTQGGGGGGAGGTSIAYVDLTSTSSVVVTVGTGGSGGTNAAGSNGSGPSSFSTFATANPGYGGNKGQTGGNNIGGVGGTSTTGVINLTGGDGASGGGTNATGLQSGNGGASYWGSGGGAAADGNNQNGNNGGAYGSGGGGATGNGTGGTGAGGIVVVYEYGNTSAVGSNVAGSSGYVQFNSGGSGLGASANLFWDNTNGRLGIGTTSPYAKLSVAGDVVAARYVATTTATSTFAGGLDVLALNQTGSATSTFQSGINVATGCFAINGTCVTGGSSQWTNVTGGINYNSGVVGIASSSPSMPLSVSGNTWLDSRIINFASTTASTLTVNYLTTATSTIVNNKVFAWSLATSTLSEPILSFDTRTGFGNGYATTSLIGNFDVNSGALQYDSNANITSIERLNMGNMKFVDDAGLVSWVDLPVSTSVAANTLEGYVAQVDSQAVLTVYGIADGSAGTASRTRVIVGSTSSSTLMTSTNIPTGSMVIANGALCVDNGEATSSCAGAVRTAGYIYSVANAVYGFDVAEDYPTHQTDLEAGDVVMLDPDNPVFVKRYDASATTTPKPFGVVSTHPGVRLGGYNGELYHDETKVPIALSGRVPVKVTGEGGNIAVGDRIAVSATTLGFGTKATSSGYTIGTALENFVAGGVEATGTVQVFIDPQYTFAHDQIVIDSATGNVGIGTTSPLYKLHVAGEVGAEAFINISTKSEKKDIEYIETNDSVSMLDTLMSLKLAKYHYNHEDESAPKHLGLIAEDAPDGVLSQGGKGVDLYKLVSLTVASIQDLASRVAKLEAITGSVHAIQSGIARFDSIFVKHIKVEEDITVGSSDKPSGIVLYDETTGRPYCVVVRNGELIQTEGTCEGSNAHFEESLKTEQTSGLTSESELEIAAPENNGTKTPITVGTNRVENINDINSVYVNTTENSPSLDDVVRDMSNKQETVNTATIQAVQP